MKKTFCIVLVLLHLLNVVGGYWLFDTLQRLSTAQLAQSFDIDSYAGSQAITIKLPVSAGSTSRHENYERVDGEFQYEGETYRLIKQKFYRDTAYIVCYKDKKSVAIKDALEEYVKSFTDNPAEKKTDGKKHPSFAKDYIGFQDVLLPALHEVKQVTGFTSYLNWCPVVYDLSVDHPPEVVS